MDEVVDLFETKEFKDGYSTCVDNKSSNQNPYVADTVSYHRSTE
jgi:hypothetical protein